MFNLESNNDRKTEERVNEIDNLFTVVQNTPKGHLHLVQPTMNPANSNQILFLDAWKNKNNFVYDIIEKKYVKNKPENQDAKDKTVYLQGMGGQCFCSITDTNDKLGSFFTIDDLSQKCRDMMAGIHYRIFNAKENRWQSPDTHQIILRGDGYPGSRGKCIRYGKWILIFGFMHTLNGLNINVYEINNINQRLTHVKTINFKEFSKKECNQPLRLYVGSNIVLLPKHVYHRILAGQDTEGSCNDTRHNNFKTDRGNIAVFLLSNGKEFFRSFVALKINFTNIHGTNSIQIMDDCSFFSKTIEPVLGKIFGKDDRYVEYSVNVLCQRYLIFSGGFGEKTITNESRSYIDRYIMQNMFYFDLLKQQWQVCTTKLPYPMAQHVVFFIDKQNKHKNKHGQLKESAIDWTEQQELQNYLNTLEMHVIGFRVAKNKNQNLPSYGNYYVYERFHFHADMSKMHLFDFV